MLELAITPVVTEKSTMAAAQSKYVFYVPLDATKVDVTREIEKIYGKKVEKVNMISTRAKVRVAGKRQMTKRKEKRKAIVTFANKETIDINKTK
jgi:large subunit ribosomal protein L23